MGACTIYRHVIVHCNINLCDATSRLCEASLSSCEDGGLYIIVRTRNAKTPSWRARLIGGGATSGDLEMDEATIDRDAMGRLAKALAFVCGADHPTTVALKAAAESGTERDIKNARTLFLRLKQSDRRAALAMLED